MFMKKSAAKLPAICQGTLLTAAVLTALTGCGGKKEAPTDEITGYLIEDASDYVTLGNYKNLPVTLYTYVISDDEVENTIMNRMIEEMTYETVDRPAEMGDVVTLALKASGSSGELFSADDMRLELGMEEYGYPLDEALEGLSAGDELDTVIRYEAEDAPFEEWIGEEIRFTGKISAVEEGCLPDLTDEYVKKQYGFDSVDEYRENVREELEKSSALSSKDEAVTELIDQAVSGCTFKSYPDIPAPEYAEEETDMDPELTQMLLEEEMRSKLFISALFQKENLVLTNSEYDNYLSILLDGDMSSFGTAEELEKGLGRDLLVWNAYTYMAGNFLYDEADVTEELMEYSPWDFSIPEDPDADIGEVIEGIG